MTEREALSKHCADLVARDRESATRISSLEEEVDEVPLLNEAV